MLEQPWILRGFRLSWGSSVWADADAVESRASRELRCLSFMLSDDSCGCGTSRDLSPEEQKPYDVDCCAARYVEAHTLDTSSSSELAWHATGANPTTRLGVSAFLGVMGGVIDAARCIESIAV